MANEKLTANGNREIEVEVIDIELKEYEGEFSLGINFLDEYEEMESVFVSDREFDKESENFFQTPASKKLAEERMTELFGKTYNEILEAVIESIDNEGEVDTSHPIYMDVLDKKITLYLNKAGKYSLDDKPNPVQVQAIEKVKKGKQVGEINPDVRVEYGNINIYIKDPKEELPYRKRFYVQKKAGKRYITDAFLKEKAVKNLLNLFGTTDLEKINKRLETNRTINYKFDTMASLGKTTHFIEIDSVPEFEDDVQKYVDYVNDQNDVKNEGKLARKYVTEELGLNWKKLW